MVHIIHIQIYVIINLSNYLDLSSILCDFYHLKPTIFNCVKAILTHFSAVLKNIYKIWCYTGDLNLFEHL